jgi:hypothetical protein
VLLTFVLGILTYALFLARAAGVHIEACHTVGGVATCRGQASSGNCYEPGEFCPHADAGMTGLAGDGKQITCENNNGLRWEPT